MSNHFWKKVSMFSFILSILIVFLHNTTLSYFDGNTKGYIIGSTFINVIASTLTQMAVPAFFIQSGVLFYRNYRLKSIMSKYKSRFFSLVVPYLIWNMIYMLIMMVIACIPTLTKLISSRELFTFSVDNIVRGIFLYKYNGVYWYMFDLIVFTLLAPIIYLLLNKKWGIITIVAIFFLNMLGIELPTIFFRSDALLYYVIGCYVGIHFFDKYSNKKDNKIARLSIILICLATIGFWVNNIILAEQRHYSYNAVRMVLLIIMVFSSWYSLDVFKNILNNEITKMSFMIYTLHWFILPIFVKGCYSVFPKSGGLIIVDYILSSCLTVGAIILLCNIWKKFFPRIYSICAGSR